MERLLYVLRSSSSGASGGSPVQEHELLLVGIPTQARAYLQSVVVIPVKPEATNRTNNCYRTGMACCQCYGH